MEWALQKHPCGIVNALYFGEQYQGLGWLNVLTSKESLFIITACMYCGGVTCL